MTWFKAGEEVTQLIAHFMQKLRGTLPWLAFGAAVGALVCANIVYVPHSRPFIATVASAPNQLIATQLIVNPDTAGAISEWEFRLQIAAGDVGVGDLPAGIGEIEVVFDKDAGVPDFIDRNDVLVKANLLTNDNGDGGSGPIGANQVVPLQQDPVMDVLQSDPRRRTLTAKIPDMDPTTGTGATGIGVQGIAGGAEITLTITTNAGVSNEPEVNLMGNLIFARRSPAGEDRITSGNAANARVQNKILISAVEGSRGLVLIITGVGFVDGKTATIWLDNGVDLNANGIIDTPAELALRRNGVRDLGELDLGFVVVGDDHTFTLPVTINNPPFALQNPNVAGRFNVINAVGGEGETPIAGVNDATFELKPTVQVTPNSAPAGDSVTVSLFDYPPGGLINRVAIGGVSFPNLPALGAIAANGQAAFVITLPAFGSGGQPIPTGTQPFEVCTDFGTASESCQDTEIVFQTVLCTSPGPSDWIVSQTCTITENIQAPANVVVLSGVALTIAAGASLNINFLLFHLLIEPGGTVFIEPGGKIH